LGASHQLVPVLINGRLYSLTLAYISFILAATGIPLLAYGFYFFNLGWPAKLGGLLVSAAVFVYLTNLAVSIIKSKNENIHAVFVFTAAVWLLLTTIFGTLLVYNFTFVVFQSDSVRYLPLHAHMGIAGWFLLLVIGVGSRLVPMFLISKYTNTALLWIIYVLLNSGLLGFIVFYLYFPENYYHYVPVAAILASLGLFGYYCYNAFDQRIRRQVDEPMKISLLSVIMMLVPVLMLLVIIGSLLAGAVHTRWVLLYGFVIFFGWITAIILGMTFKTLPFIIWNKEYHLLAGLGKTPNPKDLFSDRVFTSMSIIYLSGFALFIAGICFANIFILNIATILLFITALLYNWNVIKLLMHKSPQT
jgi:hypothetical protein